MSPRFMPMSQTKNAAPTGPTPSAMIASHCPIVSGQTVVSTMPCTSAASSAVARQKPATASVGTAFSLRDITE
jgi:hypothetical protein